MSQLQKDEEVQYIAAIFTWFRQCRIRKGEWPQLPQSKFNLSLEMKVVVDSYLALMMAKVKLSLGEMHGSEGPCDSPVHC